MAKVRSPNYPTTDLGTALELIRPAFKAENRNKMSRAVLANHMGDKTLHGRALTKLGAVRAYGLIEGSGDELRLSDDAVFVLASPDQINVHYREALERLAFKPQLFRDIKEQFPSTLPSEHNLSFWLVQQHFTQEAAGKAAKSFLSTMRLVYSQPEEYNPPTSEVELPMQSAGQDFSPIGHPKPRPGGRSVHDNPEGFPPTAARQHERELTTGLLAKNASFRLLVTGNVGVKEIERLIKKLELDKEILADQGEDEEAAN